MAPLPASGGRTDRHRLSPQRRPAGHAALHRVVLTRVRHDPLTQTHVARRLAQGLRRRDAIRCLQRHSARDLFRHLHVELTVSPCPHIAANAA